MSKFLIGSLKNIATGKRGVSYKPQDIVHSENQSFKCLLNAGNIQAGTTTTDSFTKISEKCVSEDQLISPNEILVCMSNGSKRLVGKSSRLRSANSKRFCVGAFCSTFSPTESADADFVYHIFQSDLFKKQVSDAIEGSAINNLKNVIIEEFQIPIPPLLEQQKISEILNSIDQSCQKINLKISKLIHLKNAFQSNFIPNKNKENFLNCKEFSLDSFCERVVRNNSVNVKDVLTISSTQGWIDQKRKWARNMAGKSIEKYILLKRGEFSYNKGNSKTYPQGCVFRLDKWEEALVPNVYHSFKINHEIIDSDYLQVFFSSGGLNEDLRKVITSSVRGNGLLNITANTFFQQTILLPSLSDQKNIAKKIINLNIQIEHLKNKLSKIQYLKKCVSQDLFSGRKSVKV